AAVLLQAVMFGVLHLNLNQMAYAIVLGFAFGLAVSATGSIWCGFLGHMMVNSASVAAMAAMSRMPGNMLQQSMDLSESPFWKTQLLAVLPLLAFVGIAAAGLSMLLLRAMAYTEGREKEFRQIFAVNRSGVPKLRVCTLPAVLALILGIVFIAIRLVISL
ncbi:MAG: CPBP family intramembrane metalloprotease, partial [Lachnospiraceae bacterium]|nr:CPBP family intramembrane metalloprotease [Lachnospiraceae bacterium]